MADFSESLSIRILADSSQFQSELGRVLERMDGLNRQLERLGGSSRSFRRMEIGLRRLMQPLSQVSARVQRLTSQVRLLSGQSITLNVGPALAALNRLSAAISRVAAQLATLSGVSAGGFGASAAGSSGAAAGGGVGGRASGGGRRMHSGGLVTGRSGLDQVPAMLTAGEYVLRKSVVAEIGPGVLEEWNRQGNRTSRAGSESISQAGQTVHQYGEISVHVNQVADVSELLKDLQLEGHRLRNRRG